MTFIRRGLLLIVSSLLVFGCSQSERTTAGKLQGHWHMYEPYHVSLDIFDSSVSLNKYAIDGSGWFFPLFDTLGRISLPVACESGVVPGVTKFSVTEGILEYDSTIVNQCNAYGPWRFIKSDTNTCKRMHLFSTAHGSVIIERFQKSNQKLFSLKSEEVKSLNTIFLMIGYPEKPEQFGSEPKILATDVFIEFQEISILVSSSLKSVEGHPLNLAIIADASVSQPFIDKTIEAVRKTEIKRIFQMASSSDDELGYVEIKR